MLLVTADNLESYAMKNVANYAQAQRNLAPAPQQLEESEVWMAKIEIINDFQIINAGDKVTPGQSALLDKLKIRPFEFKMTVNFQIY